MGLEDPVSELTIGYPVPPGPELTFETGSPLEIYQRLSDRASAGDHVVTEQERGQLAKAKRDYEEWVLLTQPPTTPPPPRPAPPKPKKAIAPSKPVEAAPISGDSPQLQGAPEVDAEPADVISVQRNSSGAPPLVSRSAPSDTVYSQSTPLPPEEAVQLVNPLPSLPEVYEMIRRATRNAPQPGEPDPTFSTPFAQAPVAESDPIDLFTGSFSTSVDDLTVPTPYIPIVMSRSYRSGRPYFGPFGYGWDHSYNVYLRPLKDGSIALWTGQLQEWRFRDTGGGFEPDPGIAAGLERVPGFSDVFAVRFPGGRVWLFQRPAAWGDPERIPLAEMRDRHGNAVRLTYDTQGRVATAFDGAGRGLRFHYGDCGLLGRVSDHTGMRVVQYEHDPEIEHLTSVLLPATAQYPEGIRTSYEYDSYNAHPAMKHNILRIHDAQDALLVENEYAGPEAGWEFNSVVRQRSAGFEYQFEYQQIQYVEPDPLYSDVLASRTLVRTPDGAVHTYTFNYRGDLLDHRYRLNRDGSFRVIARQREYDREGNLVAMVDPDGLRTLFTYDSSSVDPCARRNLLRIELAAPLSSLEPSRIIFQAQYEPTFQLPRRLRTESGAESRMVYDLDITPTSASGRLMRIELPSVTLVDGSPQQSVIAFESNPQGQVTAVLSPEGARKEQEYIAEGITLDGMLRRVISDADGIASVTEYEYDGQGFPSKTTAPGGRETKTAFNAQGQLEELLPPSVAGGTSSPLRQFFGDDGSVARMERPRGDYSDSVIVESYFIDLFERDLLGNLVAAHQAVNTSVARHWRQCLNHLGQPMAITDALGNRTHRCYDERGLLIRETRAVGTPDEEATHYTYDRAGRSLRTTYPGGAFMEVLERDLWGRPLRVRQKTGAIQTFEWGVENLMLKAGIEGIPEPGLPSRKLREETYEYDRRKRLLSETRLSFVDDPSTAVAVTTRYLHDRGDRLRKILLPGGATILYDYDGMDRTSRITDELGNSRDFVYNAAGDLQELTVTETGTGAARQSRWHYTHDERGRLRISTEPGWQVELTYDERNAIVARHEPGGVTVRFETSPFGETTERTIDPGGLALKSRWDFDAGGRLRSYTDPTGAMSSWEHDALGRIRLFTLPDGSKSIRTFSSQGLRLERVAPSGTRLLFDFDGANDQPVRMECLPAPGVIGVPVHDFVFDPLGQMIRASSVDGMITRSYDSFGRLVEEVSRGKTLRFSYNDAAQTAELEFPDGRRERTGLDPQGRPTRISLIAPGTALGGASGEIIAEIQYATGRSPSRISHSNGVSSEFVYDDAGRLIRLEHTQGGRMLDSYRTRYDVRGRPALVQHSRIPEVTTLNSFDTADRLRETHSGFAFPPLPDISEPADHATAIAAATLAASAATLRESYNLDQADDRLQLVRIATGATTMESSTFTPDHQLLSLAGQPVTHHADGHRATDGRHIYDVDALGRTVRMREKNSGAILAELAYDALSRPVSGTLAGEAFTRWFAGKQWIHELHPGTGSVRQVSPHPLLPMPLCVHEVSGVRFPHPDGGMATACVTDGAGAVLERHRYGTFGAPSVFAADGATPIAPQSAVMEPIWRGMPYLAPLGLYATIRRLYDPEAGAWLSRDPLLYIDSPSPYVYASHNPASFADPYGLAKSPLSPAKPVPPPPAPDWTTVVEWYYPRPDPKLIQPVTSYDSGNRVANFALNKVVLPWRNWLSFYINIPLAAVVGTDEALEHSPVQQEYQAFKDLSPLEGTMGLAIEAGPALEYSLAWLSTNKTLKNIALTPYAFMMGVSTEGGSAIEQAPAAVADISQAAARGSRTASGAIRDNPKAWSDLRDLWGDVYGVEAEGTGPLSKSNLWKIDHDLVPKVDARWIEWFPEHAQFKGEIISQHHIGTIPFVTPLTKTEHYIIHGNGRYSLDPGWLK
ncbi:MAG: DUF6531 domain-containing protein [Armatimonas sp.]